MRQWHEGIHHDTSDSSVCNTNAWTLQAPPTSNGISAVAASELSTGHPHIAADDTVTQHDDAHPDTDSPTGSASDSWTPLQLQLGLPLIPPQLNTLVCKHALVSPPSVPAGTRLYHNCTIGACTGTTRDVGFTQVHALVSAPSKHDMKGTQLGQ